MKTRVNKRCSTDDSDIEAQLIDISFSVFLTNDDSDAEGRFSDNAFCVIGGFTKIAVQMKKIHSYVPYVRNKLNQLCL